MEKRKQIYKIERKKNMYNDFIYPEEVSELLNIATSTAYKVIRSLNTELKNAGYKTRSGRVSRKYFNERFGLKVS